MASEAALSSIIDPLLVTVELPFQALFHPFGFPAQIETNSRLVLDAAKASWGELPPQFPEPPVLARFIVSEGEGQECPPQPVWRAQRNLLTAVADAENFGVCDLARGFGAAWLNQTVAAEAEYLRYCFVEGIVSAMIETLYLVSVHAACVALDGRGVLLTGDSCAGKSSLAYACARRGWTYLSDDSASLVRKREGRSVIGRPERIRFRETVGDLFPELGGRKPRMRANGDPSIEIRTSELAGIKTAFETQADYIVFLDRRPEYGMGAKLVPFPKEEARTRLHADVWPAELPTHWEQAEAVRRLLAADIFELRYRDLDAAVDKLEDLVRRGR